jgi:hypothetical protein
MKKPARGGASEGDSAAMADGPRRFPPPWRADKVPAGPDWVHEIKHDGYRLQVRRDADRSFVSSMKASSAYSRSFD